MISIHAPRVGSDLIARYGAKNKTKFQSTLPVWGATFYAESVHSGGVFQSTLPVWGATCFSLALVRRLIFQSTLPVWGATCHLLHSHLLDHNFNPRSPCGERQKIVMYCLQLGDFNPRSPCGERPAGLIQSLVPKVFQSTLPVWGATRSGRSVERAWCYFNPRSPCGERPVNLGTHTMRKAFQSTLPVWGATVHPTARCDDR